MNACCRSWGQKVLTNHMKRCSEPRSTGIFSKFLLIDTRVRLAHEISEVLAKWLVNEAKRV